MIKPGLLFDVQNAIAEAKDSGTPVRKENLQLEADGQFSTLSLEVIPFQAPPNSSRNLLICFEDGNAEPLASGTKPATPATGKQEANAKLVAQLKQELSATKEYQQSIIEALEASNEELQSANEEIQSGNEELQSTNEELQTSKEELESANEELNTVNEEMQHRNYQLAQTNNDLANLLTSVNIPILMLNSDLTIRRFTPKAEEVLGLTASDIGRLLVRVRFKFNVPEFEHIMLEVMRDNTIRQREFMHDGILYRLRAIPYRTSENEVEGVVATFFDVANLKTDRSLRNWKPDGKQQPSGRRTKKAKKKRG